MRVTKQFYFILYLPIALLFDRKPFLKSIIIYNSIVYGIYDFITSPNRIFCSGDSSLTSAPARCGVVDPALSSTSPVATDSNLITNRQAVLLLLPFMSTFFLPILASSFLNGLLPLKFFISEVCLSAWLGSTINECLLLLSRLLIVLLLLLLSLMCSLEEKVVMMPLRFPTYRTFATLSYLSYLWEVFYFIKTRNF